MSLDCPWWVAVSLSFSLSLSLSFPLFDPARTLFSVASAGTADERSMFSGSITHSSDTMHARRNAIVSLRWGDGEGERGDEKAREQEKKQRCEGCIRPVQRQYSVSTASVHSTERSAV